MGNNNSTTKSQSLSSIEKNKIMLHNNVLISNPQLHSLLLQQNEKSLNVSNLNNYQDEKILYKLFKNYNINHLDSTISLSTSIPESPGWDSSTSTLNNNNSKSFFPSNMTNFQSISTLTVSNEKLKSSNNEYYNPTIGNITNTFLVDEPDNISDTTIRTSRPFSIEHDNNSEDTATLHPSLFNSDEFYSLTETHVISLLQRDDIEINEIEIWNQIILWGIKNTLNLSSNNLLEWNNQDFESLKETLKNCIPWIRFFQIQPQEFANYVWPYKKILPQSIIGNFLRQQITGHAPIMEMMNKTPPRIPSSDIDSLIMTGRHATILASWIHQGPYSGKCHFNFNLIYRSSKDGLSLKLFHENCDDKGPTILVIKLLNSNHVVGVYNPLSYQKSKINLRRKSLIYNNNSKRRSNSFDVNSLNIKETKKDTFLFSFKTRYYPEETALISRIIPEYSNEAIIKHPNNNGLCFGIGPDLQVNLDKNDKFGKVFLSSYQNPILNFEGNFEFEEIEVFQVLRKSGYQEEYYF
ncbi:hypothetical protein C1645_793442, partial [Glomus cerebriforme]